MNNRNKLSKMCRRNLMKKPNVIGVGMGCRHKNGQMTDVPAIVVLVSKKIPREDLHLNAVVPRSVRGNIVDVIEIGEVRLLGQEVGQFEENSAAAGSRLRRYRPAPGGVSVGHFKISAGTLGAAVKEKGGGRRLILSNNHVLANTSAGNDGRSAIGDAVLQPGAYDGGTANTDTFALLKRFVPLKRTLQRSPCAIAGRWEKMANQALHLFAPHYRINLQKVYARGNLVDAAVAAPLNDADLADEILGLGRVNRIADATVGQIIRFSGRTSGLVQGNIIAEDVSLFITMDSGEQLYFVDQLIASAVCRPGDSGSLLVDIQNQAVGLLFAGSDKVSVCNRIDHVCRLLEIEF